MAKRSARPTSPVPNHEEARQLAADATTLEELEAALSAFREHVRTRWYEVRTPEKVDRAARMLAGSARGFEMHLAAGMTAQDLLATACFGRNSTWTEGHPPYIGKEKGTTA
jgi:hypothetical protein